MKNQTTVTVQKKRRRISLIIVIIVIAIAVTALFFVLKRQAAQMLTMLGDGSEQEITVTVSDISNTVNGSGTLSHASSSDILIPEGIDIKKVYVSTGDTVKKGQKLASIDPASAAGALYELNNQISSLEADIKDLPAKANDSSSNEYLQKVQMTKQLDDLKSQKNRLSSIYQTGLIKADCDGVIDAVNIAPDTTSGKESNEDSNTDSSVSDQLSNFSSMLGMSAQKDTYSAVLCDTTATTDNASTPSTDAPVAITEKDLAGLKIAAPKSGKTPQTKVDAAKTYTGIINWDCQGTFEMGSSYTATILLTAKKGYAFSTADDYGIIISGATLSNDTPKVIGGSHTEGNKLLIKATFQTSYDGLDGLDDGSDLPDGLEDGDTDNSDLIDSIGDGITQDQINKAVENFLKKVPKESTVNPYAGLNESDLSKYAGNLPSDSDLDTSGLTGSQSDYASGTEMTAFTIASGKKMKMSISINELDINSVKVGQEAEITMDALEGKTFSGKITSLRTSTSDGTVSYLAEITLKRESGMRSGMSASASVKVAEARQVPVIPVDALQEDGDQYFVFTTRNKKDNSMGGKKTVVPGISNGKQVEIRSGLNKGDTVCYNKSTDAFDEDVSDEGGSMEDE